MHNCKLHIQIIFSKRKIISLFSQCRNQDLIFVSAFEIYSQGSKLLKIGLVYTYIFCL